MFPKQRRRKRVPVYRLVVAALAMLAGGTSASRVAAQQQADTGLSPQIVVQINALLAEKASRTPAQQKMDSHLVYAENAMRGRAMPAGMPVIPVNLSRASDGRVELDVRANVSDALLDQLRARGAEILETNPAYRDIRLLVALGEIESIAALPDVIFVGPKQQAIVWGAGAAAAGIPLGAAEPRARKSQKQLDRAALIANVQKGLSSQESAANLGKLTARVGSVTSQGDATHKASNARSNYTVDGTGVKVGVLSDGVASLSAAQSTGDVDYVTVVPGQTGSGDEGTAMLEIVHDLAPGAQLYFATGFTSITSFANNIRTLRNTYGCDIIVDDIGYFVESPFQDGQTGSVISSGNAGILTQAVKDVVAAGALYFSSAGNSGNVDAGTSGTWEGNFVPGTINGTLCATCLTHNFGGQNYDVMRAPSSNPISLFWADPLGASANDYDLYRTNSTGTTVLDASTNIQNGTQDPFEIMSGAANANDRIYIVRLSGSARFLHLDTNRGSLSIVTAGSTHAHAATTAANSFGVAATPAAVNGFGGSNGPYPSSFNIGNRVEPFSSDGPRRIFFNGDSTAITPGNFSSTGGQLLTKPDITAADGVSVSGAGGFGASPGSCGASSGTCFFGTSAAAPHAGAIAALVKSANPQLTASEVATVLLNSVIDIHAPGWDRDSGSGIIMADAAIGGMPNCGTFAAAVNYSTGTNPFSVAVADLNGDGIPDLAFADDGSNSVWILLGNGDGTFAAAVNYGAGTNPVSVAIGDLNGDGKPDLAVVDGGGPLSTTVSILLGNGDGTFAPALNYGVGQMPISVAIGDLNGDGKPDLAVANYLSANISILLGNGNGTFAPAINYDVSPPTYSYPTSVAIGDLNGDGKPDLAVATEPGIYRSDVSIFLGNGDGTFAPAVRYGGDSGDSVAISDVNRDGKPDLVVGGGTVAGPVLKIYLGNGNGTFAPAVSYYLPINIFFSSIAIGDLNRDGKPDLAFADYDGGVWVMLNTCADEPDLTVTKTHTGHFMQGQVGASYTITVSNVGKAPTSGAVIVTDTLPDELTPIAMSGVGWNCTLGPAVSCTRSDLLAANASYPPITLTVIVASNAPTIVTNTATVSGGGEIDTSNDTVDDPTIVNLIAPRNLTATASSISQVSLTWDAVAAASSYQVFRRDHGGPYTLIESSATTTFSDALLSPNTSYVYQVRAVDTFGVASAPSNADLATTILFTDDPISAGSTIIKAVHLTELRIAVNAVRVAAGLSPVTFTDTSAAGLIIKAIHVTELRSNLDTARSTLSLPALSYTDGTITASSTIIKAAHFTELRNGVK